LSLQIAKIKGIPVRAHITLAVIAFLMIWSLAGIVLPETYPGLHAFVYWITGIFCSVIYFISILLHELSHSLMAIRYGLKVREVLLFIFGGVSVIGDEDIASKNSSIEFRIAIIGPITSLIIATALATSFWILLYLYSGSKSTFETGNLGSISVMMTSSLLQFGALFNLLIAIINLVPVFPTDGGKILRATLFKSNGDYDRSTQISGKIGVAISYGFMGLGLYLTISGSYLSGVWLLLVGWFLNNCARSYLAKHKIMCLLFGVRLSTFTTGNVEILSEDCSVNDLIGRGNRSEKDLFPLMDERGHFSGIVAYNNALSVRYNERNFVHLKDIKTLRSDLFVMDMDATAVDALKNMINFRIATVFICNEEGNLVGIAEKKDIIKAARARKQLI
jgi:Zn-dependent protease/predicted transcriptional regulator